MEEKDNKYVAVAYKLYTITEGKEELLEETSEGQPFLFISNMGVNLPAFEDKLTALNAGENFDFVIPQTEAFGEYHEEAVQELDKKVFYVHGQFDYKHIREDAVVPLMNEAGERFMAHVLEVRDNTVVIDLNHPLAGSDLHFVGQVLESRPATVEEVAQMARILSGEGGCGGCGGKEGGCGGCDSQGGGCGEGGCCGGC